MSLIVRWYPNAYVAYDSDIGAVTAFFTSTSTRADWVEKMRKVGLEDANVPADAMEHQTYHKKLEGLWGKDETTKAEVAGKSTGNEHRHFAPWPTTDSEAAEKLISMLAAKLISMREFKELAVLINPKFFSEMKEEGETQ